jgi:anti-sigma-K factor RskA
MTTPHANPEDLDLYALGALDGEEKQRFEEHLRACPACQRDLAAARSSAALLAFTVPPVAPPASVKSALMQKVKAEPHPAARQIVPVKSSKKRWGLRFSLGFGLATAAFAFATFELAKSDLERGKQIKQLQAQLSKDESSMQAMGQVTSAPDSAEITLLQQPGGPPGQAHVMYNARMGMAVYSGQLAPAPTGKSYQLWLVPASGAPVSAGLVEGNQQSGAVVVHLAPGLVAKAFAVTVEPQGGMPQPTGPKVLVGAASAS